MTPAFYEDLKGEMSLDEWNAASKTVGGATGPPNEAAIQADKNSSKGTIGYEL